MSTAPMQTNQRTLRDRDRGYRWLQSEHSLLHQVRIAINDSNLSTQAIWKRTYDATGETLDEKTINNLMNGKTKKPQLRTVELIMRGLGYHLHWIRYH